MSRGDFKQFAESQLSESAEVKVKSADALTEILAQAAEAAIGSLKDGGKILFCGNGGSAADAQHLATELIGRLTRTRAPIPALALNTNTSFITAHTNDYDFETVFSRQVEALGKPGDILIGISTSGQSKNVLEALIQAQKMDIKTVAFTGGEGGRIAREADFSLVVPSHNTQRIQEVHITIGHILCEILETAISDSLE